jgi:hypothetical protein
MVAYQAADGSWKDIKLIEKLFGQQVRQQIEKEANLTAVITYLIAKWIQKHSPGTQYSLIIKKALSFAKANASNFEQFPQLYDKHLK